MPCIYCNREISNTGSLKAHELSCKLNPNRVQHKHSPLAGKKKGAATWNKGKKGVYSDEYHLRWKEKYPNEKIFVENSTYARHLIKKRILNEKLIDYNCSICGIDAVWQNKPMPLILDHINGVNDDNRLENLRFVCSNCDTQLPTYKSKNKIGRVAKRFTAPDLKSDEGASPP